MPVPISTPIPTITDVPTLVGKELEEHTIPREQFSYGFIDIIFPTQELISQGIEAGVLRETIDVLGLSYEVYENVNNPGQEIVFGRNPETHEILLATRVDPVTDEMVWHVAGLRDLADVLGMTIGTQLYSTTNGPFPDLDAKKINALVVQEYNHAIIMQVGMCFTEFQEGVFNFAEADEAIALAKANGMTAEGDDLIYGLSDFNYCFVGNLEKDLRSQGLTDEQIKQRFETVVKNHIIKVMTHFKGQLQEYSVLNEWRGENTDIPDRYSAIFGDDDEFVKMVFETARNTDPNAKLFYNDADMYIKADYTYPFAFEKVQMLKSLGLIDAVGLQMSDIKVASSPDQDEVISTMQSWNLPIIVTSATFDSRGVNGTDLEIQQRQAEVVVQMLDACVRAGDCKGFRFWDGYGDSYSFLGEGAKATIFDENMKPKLAYFAIKEYLESLIVHQK